MSTSTERTDEPEVVAEPEPPRLTRAQLVARLALVGTFVVVAVAGAVVGVRARERDDAFVEKQMNPTTVSRDDVEKAVTQRTGRRSVSCSAQGGGALQSPWRCTAQAAGGRRVVYVVALQPNGAYRASASAPFSGFAGCCVPVPIAR